MEITGSQGVARLLCNKCGAETYNLYGWDCICYYCFFNRLKNDQGINSGSDQ